MYGENAAMLRTQLATLLRQHRIQQRLGGPGTYRVPQTTTIEQRQQLGEQIRRYRHAVLVWCLQAAGAANPRTHPDDTHRSPREPAEELHHRLAVAVQASTAGLPPLAELTSPQPFPIVETWRHAARAAALGEHDFTTDVNHGHLTRDQCLTVLKDAAEITRGLVGLDRRYRSIPGWEKLEGQGRLASAAEICTTFAGRHAPDYTVDHRGWHPPAAVIEESPRRGFGGIVQGEHNLLVHLQKFPDAHSMRLILDSQRIVSQQAAIRAQGGRPALAAKWESRARTFKMLLRETRDIRGRLGNGGPAAAQGAIVAARAQKLTPRDWNDDKALRKLDWLFTRIDTRLGEIIEHGASQRLYFLRVKLPRIDSEAGRVVHPVRERYAPIDAPAHTALLNLVRSRLRPPPITPRTPTNAASNRLAFEAAIPHGTGRRGGRSL